jgi:hypothetical protein
MLLEMQHLAAWSRALRLKKRDLLHSDVEGNRAYNAKPRSTMPLSKNANAENGAIAASE